MVRTCGTTGEHYAGCSKRPSSKAAASEGPEAYPLGYVEGLNDARTKLADFINSLLDRILKGRFGPNRLCQHSTALEFLKNLMSGRIKVCRA
jgi:hypothetical protein